MIYYFNLTYARTTVGVYWTRSILDFMTETQVLYITSHIVILFNLFLDYFSYVNFSCKEVEWTPYITSPRALLNEYPRTAFIVEVYFPEMTVRQLGFVQGIPPSYETYPSYTTDTRYLFLDLCFSIYLHGGME